MFLLQPVLFSVITLLAGTYVISRDSSIDFTWVAARESLDA